MTANIDVTEHGRLSALDWAYLAAETPIAPLHVAAIGVLDGAPLDDAGGLRLDDIRGHLRERLGLLPHLRCRVRHHPLDLAGPAWVFDDHFDIARHVHHVVCPDPGDWRSLLSLSADLLHDRLDRAWPLWQVWFITGVRSPAGRPRCALVLKMHHALVDGVAGVHVLTTLLGDDQSSNTGSSNTGSSNTGSSNTDPLAAHGRGSAEMHQVDGHPTDLVHRARTTARHLANSTVGVIDLLRGGVRAPRSSLNRPIGDRRRIETLSVPLVEIRTIKDAFGATVNDVVLAAVASGLRRLLQGRGDDVEGVTMQALIPVNVRVDGDGPATGNRTAVIRAPIPVGIADARGRMRFVAEAMRERKQHHQADATGTMLSLGDRVPVALASVVSQALVHRQDFVNLVVTNVPGPAQRLHLLGARLLELYPIAPLAGHLTVAVSVGSYANRLYCTVLADDGCRDAATLARGIRAGFAELLDALRV